MKNSAATRSGFLTFLILTGIFAGLLSFVFYPSEPRYENKRLSTWAADLLGPEIFWSQWPTPAALKKQDQAAIAIRHFGVQTLPLALRYCETEDFSLVEKLKDFGNDQKLFPIHFPSDFDYQMRGLKIFEILGTNAKPAIPSLIKSFQTKHFDYTRATISSALYYIGTDAIAPLQNELTNENARARAFAALTLGSFHEKAKISEPRLLTCLTDADYLVRNNAAQALASIGANPTNAVPALLIALNKNSNNFEFGVLYTLGYFGTNATAAVPLLVKIIVSDPKPAWSLNLALRALKKIDPKTAALYQTEGKH